MIDLILDLGIVNGYWVGEFDLPKYDVMNYPVEVETTGATVELCMTAIGTSFKGGIGDDGTLTGVGQSEGAGEETIIFRPAWDVYLVYEPGAAWDGATPPEPTFFMHQLSGRLPVDRRLDGSRLREAIEGILEGR